MWRGRRTSLRVAFSGWLWAGVNACFEVPQKESHKLNERLEVESLNLIPIQGNRKG